MGRNLILTLSIAVGAFAFRGAVRAAPVAPAAATQPASSGAMPSRSTTVTELLGRGKDIKFEEGTADLLDLSRPFLEELARALAKEPTVRLEIVSHTAYYGNAKKDLALSNRRAEAVKHALVRAGVTADRLIAVGRGSEDPILPNATRTGRLRNDRMELHRASPAR